MMSLGEDISGRISGNEISGQWHVSWVVIEPTVGNDIAGMETTAQYTGHR